MFVISCVDCAPASRDHSQRAVAITRIEPLHATTTRARRSSTAIHLGYANAAWRDRGPRPFVMDAMTPLLDVTMTQRRKGFQERGGCGTIHVMETETIRNGLSRRRWRRSTPSHLSWVTRRSWILRQPDSERIDVREWRVAVVGWMRRGLCQCRTISGDRSRPAHAPRPESTA